MTIWHGMDNSEVARFRVEVKHRAVMAHRYTWEIHSIGKAIRVQESPGTFPSWEEASCAGEAALIEFLKTHASVEKAARTPSDSPPPISLYTLPSLPSE